MVKEEITESGTLKQEKYYSKRFLSPFYRHLKNG